MELYILSKEDLSIKSIIKPSDYEINLDEETNAKTTFILKKCDGLKEGNFIVVNGLYKQFLFVIPSGGITTEKGSNIVTVTALDISNIFDRKIIKKDTDLMTNNSIEEFLAKTISENFVNSDDPYLNIPYMLINWKTETKAVVDTNAENGLYNFHTFLINCRQYKNICTDFKFKEKIKESYRTAQGKKIEIQNGKKGTHLLITTKGETNQATRSGKNLFNLNNIRNAPSVFKVTDTGVNLTNDWAGDVFTFENIAKTFKANTTYTMKAKAKVVSRPSTIVNINDDIFTFYRPASDELRGVVQSILAMPDKRTIALNTEKEYITTFTTPEDMTNVRFLSYTFRGNNDGSTTGTALGEIDVSEIMLVEGRYTTETFPEYEKYGASPSPDYRSPIENVGGKNKFNNNFSDYTKPVQYYIYPIHLEKGETYKFNTKLVGNKMTGCVIGVVKDGDQYSNFVGLSLNLNTSGNINNLSFKVDSTWVSPKLVVYAPNGETQFKQIFENYEVQLEKGSVATPYVPYNSLEIKDIGKNLLNNTGVSKTFSAGIKITVNEDKSITINGTNTETGHLYLKLSDEFILPAGDYTLSNKNQNTSGNSFTFYDDNYNFVVHKDISNATFTKDTKIRPYVRINAGVTVNNQTIYPMILKGTYTKENLPSYAPYQEQKVYFPLSEGQKLMEGSYLSRDGIHHTRKQVTLIGNETFTIQPQTNDTNLYVAINLPDLKTNGIVLSNYFSSGLSLGNNTDKIGALYSTYLYFGIPLTTIGATSNDDSSTKIQKFKTWLATQYANGTPVIVEYELSEEEIIPYTEAQQEAWNKIEELMMFEGYNSIESNAQLDIKYNYIYPENAKLIIDIENKEDNIAIIDTTLAEVTDSNKIYEANYTAKVQVLIREDNSIYNLYLKTNRTTTENKDDPDRASGKVETISVDTADKAREEALNVMKGNTYKHLVEFKIPKTSKLIDITKLYIGRKVKIKTEDDIYDSYISAITLNDENFVYFKSGNLRIDLLDKLKKQKESVGNKLDVEGGTIKNLKIEKDLDINGNYYKNGEKIDTEMQIKTGEEYATNEYIDGKRVYIKQLEFNDTVGGGQDNRLVKSHGIVGAEKIWVDLSNSYIKATTTKATYPLPVILYSGNISALSIIVDLTNIYMESQGGWGTIWTKVIRLKYTKEQEV